MSAPLKREFRGARVHREGTGEPLTWQEANALERLRSANGEVVSADDILICVQNNRNGVRVGDRIESPSTQITRLREKLGSDIIEGLYELRDRGQDSVGRNIRVWCLVGWRYNLGCRTETFRRSVKALTDRELEALRVLTVADGPVPADRIIRKRRNRQPEQFGGPGSWLRPEASALIMTAIRRKTGLRIKCLNGAYSLAVSP